MVLFLYSIFLKPPPWARLQQIALDERRKEMDEKERKRKELIALQQEEMKELAAKKREEHVDLFNKFGG